MKIVLIDDKPFIPVNNGYKAIPTLLYMELLEREKIEIVGIIEHHD